MKSLELQQIQSEAGISGHPDLKLACKNVPRDRGLWTSLPLERAEGAAGLRRMGRGLGIIALKGSL